MTNTNRVEILPINKTIIDEATGVIGTLVSIVTVYGRKVANVRGNNGCMYTVAASRLVAA